MPRLNGTGPMGQGPRTGRGMGCCGCARKFYTRKEESEMLKGEQTALEEELKAVKERLQEIKG